MYMLFYTSLQQRLQEIKMKIAAKNDAPLIDLLAVLAPECSKTTLRSWIKDGRVTVDGQAQKIASTIVTAGQTVAVGAKMTWIDDQIPILYEDRHLIALNKPEGLLTVATNFQRTKTLHAMVKDHYRPKKVYVVHRLDQDTSGVILFALSEEGYSGLKTLFEKHDIERSYYAIVEGHMKSESGTWTSYLHEDNNYVVKSVDDPTKGRLAITHYRILGSSPKYTCLQLTLETGRKNQIRVHCTDSGHPVVGDKKYGSTIDPLKRLCLHAQLIAFRHPVTDVPLRFSSPIPEAFKRLVKIDA